MYSLILNQTEIGANTELLEMGGGGGVHAPNRQGVQGPPRPPEAIGLYMLSAMEP